MKQPVADRAERAEKSAFVRELRARLSGLLVGAQTREGVAAWARAVESPKRLFGDAAAVHDSLCSVDEAPGGELLIRRHDLEAYARWLRAGEAFLGDDEPLILVSPGCLGQLDDVDATEPVRFWYSGLGWWFERRFMSPATGRPFVAFLGEDTTYGFAVHKQRNDDALPALADVVETLQLDPSEIDFVQDGVSLEEAMALGVFGYGGAQACSAT